MRLLRQTIKSLARKCGLQVSRLAYAPFGVDVCHDVTRLSKYWGVNIECIFDVGANIGQTAKKLREIFPEATIYSFEPHPDTFMKLNSNLRNDNVISINLALCDKVGEAELFSYGSDVINSLTPTAPYAVRFGESFRHKTLVKTTTLDEFCTSNLIGTIDILKVDAEGADLQVLQGAKRKLAAQDIRFIYVEFNTIFDKPGRTGGALVPICELLEPHGYDYVTSYTDYIITEGDFFAVHNALFHATPSAR